MFSLYAYLHIILLIFNNMIKNIGPDGDSAYFSASYYTIILKFSALFILKFDPPFNFSRYAPEPYYLKKGLNFV